MGNSPPARNLAVSPDTAVRLGSARICTRPTCSRAVSAPWALLGLRQGVALFIVEVIDGVPPAMVERREAPTAVPGSSKRGLVLALLIFVVVPVVVVPVVSVDVVL